VAQTGWTLNVYEPDVGPVPFLQFKKELKEFQVAALDAALRNVLAVSGLRLASTSWLTPLGEGLYEFRIRHDEAEIEHMFGGKDVSELPQGYGPILLRVFVHFYGTQVILLLSGYDKQENSNSRYQQRQITEARKHLTAWKQQEARRKAKERRASTAGGKTKQR